MTNRLLLHVVAIYMGLVYTVGLGSLVVVVSGVEVAGDGLDSQLMAEKVEIFKRDILTRLGYDKVPNMSNITQNIEEKRKMIQKYRKYIEERDRDSKINQINEEGESTIKSRTFYSLQYEGDRPRAVAVRDWNVRNTFRFYFTTHLSHPGDPTYELHIDSAKLKVFISDVRPENMADKLSVEKQIRVNVYQLISISSTSNYKRKLLDSKLVSLEGIGWESFEVGGAVQDWVDNPESNLGLEIASESQNIKDVLDISTENRVTQHESINNGLNDTDTSAVSLIDIYAQERSILKRVKRRGRRRGDCRRGDGESKCCRYPIKISFSEIGWDDWIIAPLEYRGYYCSGTCPYRYRMANTFSGIKALLHLKNPKKVPLPCCVATKLSPFTILHYDLEGRYTFSDYPDLVVEQCKCG